MQVMCYARRSAYVADLIKKQYPQATIVECTSFEGVLERTSEQGGDPNKIGIIPILQERNPAYITLATINNLHVVSLTQTRITIKSQHELIKMCRKPIRMYSSMADG